MRTCAARLILACLSGALAPLTAACQARGGAEPAAAPLAAASSELPALQRARLDYVFEAAARVRRSWPFTTPDDTCILLIEATVQWTVHCALAPQGFVPAAGSFRGHPIFHHAGGSFASAGQARSTAELLAESPAAAHVPLADSAQPTLPGSTPWLVLGSLEALAAFHPAFPEATTEAWVSVAIHELIHTHQLRAPGFAPTLAAIQDRSRDPSALTRLFGQDLRYRALVEREYALLTHAAERAPDDRRSALQALRAWRGLYAKRARHLSKRADGARLLEDDALFSYLEGTARFAESAFLDDAAQHPERTKADDPRFHDYALFVGRGYAGSPNRQLDEAYFYAIGYHLCVLLERLDPSWKLRVHSARRYLLELAEQVAASADRP